MNEHEYKKYVESLARTIEVPGIKKKKMTKYQKECYEIEKFIEIYKEMEKDDDRRKNRNR